MALNESDAFTHESLFTGTLPVYSQPETFAVGPALPARTMVGRVTATGKLKKAVKTASDGSQKPVGFLVGDIDPSAAEVSAPTYKAGVFNPARLVIDPSYSLDEVRIAFEGTPLFLRAAQSLV